MHVTTTEQLQLAHDRLVHAVERLVIGADWKAMLELSRRFRHYSLSNVLLIQAQCPEATRVAGYSRWKKLAWLALR